MKDRNAKDIFRSSALEAVSSSAPATVVFQGIAVLIQRETKLGNGPLRNIMKN